MSEQSDQRAMIVAALDGVTADVEGQTVTIDAQLVQPAPVAPYQAWPIWMATRPVAMCVAETDWQVAVSLPGADPQTWTVNGDALMDAVAAALDGWHLTRVEPGTLQVSEGGAVPLLLYTLDI